MSSQAYHISIVCPNKSSSYMFHFLDCDSTISISFAQTWCPLTLFSCEVQLIDIGYWCISPAWPLCLTFYHNYKNPYASFTNFKKVFDFLNLRAAGKTLSDAFVNPFFHCNRTVLPSQYLYSIRTLFVQNLTQASLYNCNGNNQFFIYIA